MDKSAARTKSSPDTSHVEASNSSYNAGTGAGGPASESWSVDPAHNVSNESHDPPAPSAIRYDVAEYKATGNPAVVRSNYGNKARCRSNGKAKAGSRLSSKSWA